MQKGNKPVPQNYEEHEIVVMHKGFDTTTQKFNEPASLTRVNL